MSKKDFGSIATNMIIDRLHCFCTVHSGFAIFVYETRKRICSFQNWSETGKNGRDILKNCIFKIPCKAYFSIESNTCFLNSLFHIQGGQQRCKSRPTPAQVRGKSGYIEYLNSSIYGFARGYL